MPDENGNIYSVRYDQVNAMLLNEFLKEHRKVEKLGSDSCGAGRTTMNKKSKRTQV